jgi:hypothetical protein
MEMKKSFKLESNQHFSARYTTEMRQPAEGCEKFPYLGIDLSWKDGDSTRDAGGVLLDPGSTEPMIDPMKVKCEEDTYAAQRVFRMVEDAVSWNKRAPGPRAMSTEEALKSIGDIIEWARTAPMEDDYATRYRLSHHGVSLRGEFVWSGRVIRVGFFGDKPSAPEGYVTGGGTFLLYHKFINVEKLEEWDIPEYDPSGLVDQIVQRYGLRIHHEWNGYRSVVFDMGVDPSKAAVFRSSRTGGGEKPGDLPERWA